MLSPSSLTHQKISATPNKKGSSGGTIRVERHEIIEQKFNGDPSKVKELIK